MNYFFGVSLFGGVVWLCMNHLHQPVTSYTDFVAFLVVLGGTTSVTIITFPWEYGKDVWRGLSNLFFHRSVNKKNVLEACMTVISRPHQPLDFVALKIRGMPREILQDGQELIELALPTERIETILRERIFQSGRRAKRVAQAFKSLAKYPPAFGLVGTVLGLVNLMRGISAGMDAKQTGVEMAVALVATLYGLMTANLLINPAGEMILKSAQEDEETAEMALQAILLASDKTSLLESQELMNSFVSRENRINALDRLIGSDAA